MVFPKGLRNVLYIKNNFKKKKIFIFLKQTKIFLFVKN